jgi:hypothetical protein
VGEDVVLANVFVRKGGEKGKGKKEDEIGQ